MKGQVTAQMNTNIPTNSAADNTTDSTTAQNVEGRNGRPALDLSVYLVTDTALCGALGVAETARQAVAAGATLVQVRDPDASDDEFVALATEVVQALRGSGVPVLLNDRVHLVAATGADGAHVGQSDMPVAEARALIGDNAILGLSVTNRAQLEAATSGERYPASALDYLGLGPMRPTSTKPNHAPPSGLDGLARLAADSPWPTCAIGGVKAADAAAIRAAGLDGMAVVSAICGQPDVTAATRELAENWHAPASE